MPDLFVLERFIWKTNEFRSVKKFPKWKNGECGKAGYWPRCEN